MHHCVPQFICKIYEIISNEKCDHIVSWTQDGSGFQITDQKLFEEQILPQYFKHNKFPSFIR